MPPSVQNGSAERVAQREERLRDRGHDAGRPVSGLSVVVITRNEEANIERCLRSAAWADEIVVVDSQSSDRTAELARAFTEKVLVTEWRGYAAMRELAVTRAAHDWILWVDADEVITAELAAEIRQTLDGDAEVAAYAIPLRTFFLGKWIRHCGWYPDYKIRLFRKDRASFSQALVHEGVIVEGPMRRLKAALLHFTAPSLGHYWKKLDAYSSLSAEEMRRQGRQGRLFDLWIRPAVRFLNMYVLRLGFLDGAHGFVLCALSSYYVFAKYAKLWEATHGSRPDPRPERGAAGP